VQSQAKKASGMSDPQRLVFGPFELDLRDERLWCAAAIIHLNPKAFAVLRCLLTQAGQLVTKDELFATVWPETVVSEAVLATAIRELRRALHDRAHTPQYIETVYGRGYRFIAAVRMAASAMARQTSAPPPRRVSPSVLAPSGALVGRESELAQLQQWLGAALQGERQVGFITGEAGIGKTALVDAFVDHVTATSDLWVSHGQCIAQYGAGEPYLPLLEAVGRLCRGADGAHLLECLRQHAPSWLRHMPALLTSSERERLQRQDTGMTRERMLRELAEALEVLTAAQPLVLVLEDLHWSDVSTLEWLNYVARRREPARVLILGTYRPVDVMVHPHPLRMVITELRQHGQCVERVLDYLSEAAVAAYLTQRFGTRGLPDGLARLLHQRTNGNPFFFITMVDEMLHQGVVTQQDTHWMFCADLEAVAVGVPESVRQLIDTQLGQISPQEQEILTAASVAGTEFSAAAVAASVEQAPEEVEVCCDALARRGQFVRAQGSAAWPDGTVAARYHFIHDLYQEVLYERVPASRRMRWHRQIGMRLEAGYGPRVQEIAAELAMHFARGRDAPRAVVYLHQAADNALRRYANREAISHLTQALAELKTLPHSHESLQHELALLIALGPALVAIKGYGAVDVEHTYTRAREICQQLGDALQLSQVLWGLATCYIVRAEHQTARDLGEQLLTLAHRQQDPALLCVGHFALGAALYCLGAFVPAREHLAQSVTLEGPQQDRSHPFLFGMDLGVFCRSWAAHALWHLGYPDQALTMSHTALARARALSHPFSLALALNYAAILHQFRREAGAIHERVEAAARLCREHEFTYYLAWGPILQGWVMVEQGQGEAGITQMRGGLVDFRAIGGAVRLPYYLGLLAEAYGHTGQAAAGRVLVAEALAQVEATEEGWWHAELYRLEGELLVQEGGTQEVREAEESVRLALTVARRQQTKALELRAAMSLARLWQRQGKQAEARALLAPIYGWFTEGFDTADLQETKALLEELGE
jgi:predicted ATPase/DNA-binding winged helix-turn-helix (wHTH) protein